MQGNDGRGGGVNKSRRNKKTAFGSMKVEVGADSEP